MPHTSAADGHARLLLACSFSLFATLFCAAPAGAWVPHTQAQKVVIEGHVTYTGSNAPVQAAVVTLTTKRCTFSLPVTCTPTSTMQAATGPEGYFSFEVDRACDLVHELEAGSTEFVDGRLLAPGRGSSGSCGPGPYEVNLPVSFPRAAIRQNQNAGERRCESVGRPVNVTDGNMYLRQTDYRLPSHGPAVDLTRTYNSSSTQTGLFGRGWSTRYDELVRAYDSTRLLLQLPSGRSVFFTRADASSAFLPETQYDFRAQVTRDAGGGYALTQKSGGVQRFNPAGRLSSIEDRNGNRTTLTYGPAGILSSITDASGRTLRVETDAAGRAVFLSDEAGPVASYTYGPAQELLSVAYPDGSGYVFEYASVADRPLLTSVRDRLGNLVEAHEYDAEGRAVTSARDGGAERYTLAYVGAGETRVTDGLGRVTRYLFDASRPLRVLTRVEGQCACGGSRVETWTHDAQLNATSQTDALGRSVSYTYDSSGNVLTATDAAGATRFTYDAFGQVLTAADPLGNVTRFAYDARGNLLSVADAEGGVTSFTYDARGLPLTVTDPRGQVSARLAYDARGQLVRRADALGGESAFAYDARGRLASATDALGRTTVYTYDEAGRVRRVTRADGATLSFDYDLAGRLTRSTDPLGQSTLYEYDGAYRTTSVTDPLGGVRTFRYDEMSNLASVIDPLGQATEFSYDDFDRLARVVYPEAGAGAARLEERFEYDAAGALTRRIETDGRATLYAYDALGRLSRVTDPSGGETAYSYDARSQLVALTDAVGQRYEFAYDRAGRPAATRRAGLSETYAYDPAGNRVRRTDYDGAVTSYSYDALSRLNGVSYPDGTSASYAYDALSRLTAATNEAGTVSLSYDPLGRLSSATDVWGRVLSYDYDAAGRRTRALLDSLPFASYQYDALSRLTRLSDRAGRSFSYAYDELSRPVSRVASDGFKTAYAYDGLGRLTRLSHARGPSLLADYSYAYDARGRVTRIDDREGAHLYTYDSVGRLTSAAHAGRPAESYAYDAVGNRTSSHLAAAYAYEPFNRLTAAGAERYDYDANGNRTEMRDGAGKRAYSWDFENRLTRVAGPGPSAVSYSYDALGRLVRRAGGRRGVGRGRPSRPGTQTTDFTYDGADVILDASNDGTTTEYLDGPGLDQKLRQRRSTGAPLYFLTDHLGTTRALAGAGDFLERFEYDSFGSPVAASGGGEAAPTTRYGFTGREHDPDTGLVYYRARWYDPRLGRFISEDPAGLDAGPNLYAYVGNDPLNKTDPLGLYEADVHRDLTYFLARNNRCFTDREARAIAFATQDIDEQPDTWPARGGTVQQQWQNIHYHALHPASRRGRASPVLWAAALENNSGDYASLGAHLHYLQDTFSHEGYGNPVWGHLGGSHSVDKTASDVPKAMEMAYTTWYHLNAYARQKKCCESSWNPVWSEMVRRFAEVETNYPHGSSIDSRGEHTNLFLPDDPEARIRKRAFLGIPRPR